MELRRIVDLPDDPLAAAAAFHALHLPALRAATGDVAILFAPAEHTHAGWRLAAVQALARAATPRRVNAIEGAGEAAIAAACAWLAAAPGVTGQILRLAGGAGAGVIG
ncbi:MAG TPA: hypothetical protein VFF98_15315 [Novosphingobium sp.]|nr:hypothetical protein [Novosphingobium sp.]